MHTTRIRWCLNCTRNAALEWKYKKKNAIWIFLSGVTEWSSTDFRTATIPFRDPSLGAFLFFLTGKRILMKCCYGLFFLSLSFCFRFPADHKRKGTFFFFPGVSTPFLKHDFFPTHFSFLKVWTKENWMKETIKFRPFCLSFWTIQSLIAPLVSHAVKVELGASNFIPTSAPCARTV